MNGLFQPHFFSDFHFESFAQLFSSMVRNRVCHPALPVYNMAGTHLSQFHPAICSYQFMKIIILHSS